MSSRGAVPSDAPVRSRATSDLTTNLVVLAGAGTGKTSLLVERALTALLTGHCRAAEVAAITFTEKAAAEMQHRLAGALESACRMLGGGGEADGGGTGEARRVLAALAAGGDHGGEGVARRARAALGELERLRVTTIHAFCADLLRTWPRQAGVDPGFRVDTGEQVRVLAEEAWATFLAGELGAAASRPHLWRRLLAAVPVARLRAAGLALAGHRIPRSLLDRPGQPPEAGALFAGAIQELTTGIQELLADADRLTPLHRRTLEAFHQALEALARDGAAGLREALAQLPDLAERLRKGAALSGGKRTGAELGARVEQVDRDARGLLSALLEADDPLAGDLVDALTGFALNVRETALARGWLEFDALLALTRDLLLHHPEVREAVKQRLRLLLVDEFQDTDPVQYDIVLLLAEAPGRCADDPLRAQLGAGRLFIVGDAKQSIYRFRGADTTAFRRTVERVRSAGGEVLNLTSNFRSRPEILQAVNELFTPAGAWPDSAYQPPYVPIDAVRDAAGEARVEIWSVDPGPAAGAEARRRAEAEVLAREITALVGGGHRRDPRLHWGEISILLRAFTHLSHVARALRRHRIPFVVDGGKEFMTRPEVEHLLALLRTLARPEDPVALLAFLRSPGGGVPDAELAAFAATGRPWSWRRAGTDGLEELPHLAAVLAELRRLHHATCHLPDDARIRRVLHLSGLLAIEAAAFEGPQRAANLLQLVDAAASLVRDLGLPLWQVLETLAADVTPAAVEADSPLADEQMDAVRVLTIHKAKGLENRVVILPDLARESARSRPGVTAVDVARLPDGRAHLAVRCGDLCNSARIWLEREQLRHEAAEEQRVLYVALTRARERLILLAGPGRSRSPWLEALEAWGYDAASPPGDGALLCGGRVRHRRVVAAAPAPVEDAPTAPFPAAAVAAFQDAVQHARSGSGAGLRRPSGEERAQEAGAVTPPAAAAPAREEGVARGVGILVHRLLETWAGEPLPALRARAAALAGGVAAETDQDPRALVDGSLDVMESFLASPLAERLRQVDRLGREMPLLLEAGDGGCWRGSIDLLYREGDGALVVADFKTDRETDSEILSERHGAQLAVYAEAVRRAFRLPAPPRAELWLLRHGRVLAVDPAPALARLKLDPRDG